jgi:glycerol-3-phosphate O-acyltransferase/dihydroxyacetone phosphate acyltransferase
VVSFVFLITLNLSASSSPVKIFLHVFPSVAPWHIASVCLILGIYIFISEFKSLLFFFAKIFFQSILSIFFRDVEIIGRDNIPRHGPIIYTVNHANQFIDAVTLVCTCQHRVSLLMAETSWKRRIIGDIAWALDVVPVKRAQDDALSGNGKVSFVKNEDFESTSILTVKGEDTAFVQNGLAKGDKIRPTGTAFAVKIAEIVDDTCLLIDGSEIPAEDLDGAFASTTPLAYDILKRVDQKVVYEKVLDKLADGGCVGIFPEGGSHDRTDLLPLKVGVALIAYSALEKDGLSVPIVPVGLNYFQAHRWRGRAVVEYGHPIYVDPNTLHAYQAGGQDKRMVCNELLDRIQDSMKSVIVSTPDYETLQLIHTARRLYQGGGVRGKEKQDLARRFAEGYKRLITMVQGDPPEA